MDEKAICTEGRIWDLHIHSNQCTSADDSIKDWSADKYVDQLFNLFDNYESLDMISFTDHNRINLEVYQAFLNSNKNNGSVVLLPGCEIDVKLDDEGTSKHLVVYFDAINKLKELEWISKELNEFCEEEAVSAASPILIDKLLNKLTDLKVTFVLSPHAFKQKGRGIEYDWTSPEIAEKEASKLIDQFFCFWEASGRSNITRAQDFLKQMACDDKQSVVAFSDSRNLEGLKQYLENPHQYFHSLPNFTGVQMAGSDIRRITKTSEEIKSDNLGGYIGCIEFEGKKIQCSPRMNAIIGGRGSGKSVLLDTLVSKLSSTAKGIDAEHLEFLNEHDAVIKDACGKLIPADTFQFDYFNQNYIAKLFMQTGSSFNQQLESYFQEAFNRVEPIEEENLLIDVQANFFGMLTDDSVGDVTNIEGFVDKLGYLKEDRLNIKILPGNRKEEDSQLVNYSYTENLNDIEEAVKKKLPPFLRQNQRIKAALSSLKMVVAEEAHECRLAYRNYTYLNNLLVDNFFEKKDATNEAHKERTEVLRQIENKLLQQQLNYRKRVEITNAYLETAVNFPSKCEHKYEVDGENPKAFCFKKTFTIEHPLDHLVRLFDGYIKNPKNIGSCNLDTLWPYIEAFCFDEDCYKSGKSWEDLYDELAELDLDHKTTLSIWYRESKDTRYEDVSKLSPGTQTNILLEYIVYKDTDVPLLIDQPEDNVDNRTIYKKVREWFIKLKKERQVLVVSHDANIVINADAENIIIAEQEEPGVFSYTFGALEYEDNIDKAATILDGGKEAVQRRLLKYGES